MQSELLSIDGAVDTTRKIAMVRARKTETTAVGNAMATTITVHVHVHLNSDGQTQISRRFVVCATPTRRSFLSKFEFSTVSSSHIDTGISSSTSASIFNARTSRPHHLFASYGIHSTSPRLRRRELILNLKGSGTGRAGKSPAPTQLQYFHFSLHSCSRHLACIQHLNQALG
ncbi:hypothetical protein BJ138DRAFT_1160613 [Hygrophoropsis aurantiaca]|uniref:Uncharacterized protein n=1 Tax=Hygrophoropsis aurantiaca TaxID=72124 RepID=A0ACB8A2M4_9AGAM|nr:hypothetical protein BJ138DRAFT_1160613 [Hygrophoropsis aurantiaca]